MSIAEGGGDTVPVQGTGEPEGVGEAGLALGHDGHGSTAGGGGGRAGGPTPPRPPAGPPPPIPSDGSSAPSGSTSTTISVPGTMTRAGTTAFAVRSRSPSAISQGTCCELPSIRTEYVSVSPRWKVARTGGIDATTPEAAITNTRSNASSSATSGTAKSCD